MQILQAYHTNIYHNYAQNLIEGPQTAVEGMLPPLCGLLESLRLEAPVTALGLDAGATFAASAQREWFGRCLPQPGRWANRPATVL